LIRTYQVDFASLDTSKRLEDKSPLPMFYSEAGWHKSDIDLVNSLKELIEKLNLLKDLFSIKALLSMTETCIQGGTCDLKVI
jgi:hypothetical protein